MTNKGVIIRFHAEDVSQTGRGALGVRMMRLDQDAIVSSLAIVDREDETEEASKRLNQQQQKHQLHHFQMKPSKAI